MPVKTERKVLGDVLLFEEDDFYSRETGTLSGGGSYEIGLVLGRVTATDKLVPYDPAVATGAETVVGVLAQNIDTAAGDVDDVVFIARHARVKRHALLYGTSVDTPAERATAVEGLKALGILTDV
ncbi:head decoration protein [Limimaricola pyoseonensis]|uniref:Bacteriophage lambda head decoration protein D n=1 Tax=Limimaricola pyoseonensis TaxID=521013 RepID=A0A1G7GQT3_9RHOB|nr:head decoration protein [Limimaricola pyoseonensis]SDE90329.1 Bacteriophage lambda head decoration protein D [Limimaricola pyoseonensis]